MISSLSLAIVAIALSPVIAQTKIYKWKFQDSHETTVPACTRLPIDISSFDTITNNTKGSPPYYMIALAIGGTPTTTLIGTSDTDVDYTVTHPVGTRLLLSVTDSTGSPGGTYAPVTVIAGTSSSCFVTPSTSPTFTVTSNVTTELATCQPVGLSIFGGTSPYTLTLVSDNAPSVTNDTLPAGNNIYTYVNRASPGGLLVAAISDATGRWATGTPLFNTKGSADTACPGLFSSSAKGNVKAPSSSSSDSSSVTSSPSSSTSANNAGPSTLTNPGSSTSSGSAADSSATASSTSNGVMSREAGIAFAMVMSIGLLTII